MITPIKASREVYYIKDGKKVVVKEGTPSNPGVRWVLLSVIVGALISIIIGRSVVASVIVVVMVTWGYRAVKQFVRDIEKITSQGEW